MTPEVQIANMALSLSRSSILIDALTDSSLQAQTCNVMFESCRDSLLAGAAWPFAEKRKTLELHTDDPPPEWVYVYKIPADCLTPRLIADGQRVRLPQNRIPFKRAADEDGLGIIFTNQADAVLIYTARIREAVRFPIEFSWALAYMLASEIAKPLTLDARIAEENRQIGLLRRNEAVTIMRGSEVAEPTDTDAFDESRR